VLLAAFFLALASVLQSEPAMGTRAPAAFPATCTDKVDETPRFYQMDARLGLKLAGEKFCFPTSVSDSMVYLAHHGFPNLFPIRAADPAKKQADLIEMLASNDYMATNTSGGSSPGQALYGIRRYVVECGYRCDRLEYAGRWRLPAAQHICDLGGEINLDWIKAAVADPHGAAWLTISYFTREKPTDPWKHVSGHAVAVVGYGTDGVHEEPNILLIDDPAARPIVASTRRASTRRASTRQASTRHASTRRVSTTLAVTRPATRPVSPLPPFWRQALRLTPAGPLRVSSLHSYGTWDVDGMYKIERVGLRGYYCLYTDTEAAFVDGAIVMVVGEKR